MIYVLFRGKHIVWGIVFYKHIFCLCSGSNVELWDHWAIIMESLVTVQHFAMSWCRPRKQEPALLTHISLVSYFWDICKQCRPRSDAKGLHCLLTGISILNRTKMKNVPQTPLKLEMDSSKGWTGPQGKCGLTRQHVHFYANCARLVFHVFPCTWNTLNLNKW